MLRLVVAFCAALVVQAKIASHPTPQQQQPNRTAAQQRAADNHAPTKASSPPVDKREPARAANDSEQRSTQRAESEEGSVKVTDWIVAIATAVLAVVTFFLARYTYKLWNATKDLVADAARTGEQQSIAMERQHAVMAKQQAAMEAQARAMESQGQQLVQSVRLAEAEFVATHRPRLRVRNIVVRPGEDGRPFPADLPLTGQFYCANVGDSEATITDSGCWVHWGPGDLPMRRPYEGEAGNNPIPKLTAVKAGVSVPGGFGSGEKSLKTAEGDGIVLDKGWKLWVLGWIEYRDAEATPRRTTFCRRFDPEKRRFVRVDDPDYEHEE